MNARGKRSFVSFLLIGCLNSLFISQVIAGQLTVGLNVTGTTLLDTGFPYPDITGGVGPSHIVELVNLHYSVYRKSDGVRVQSSPSIQFWADAGVTLQSPPLDSRVLYDPFSERWFAASSEDVIGGADNLLLAVSKSSNPTLGWTGFSVPFSGLPNSPDVVFFPTLGVNKDGVYVHSNFVVLVMPKADLLATPPTISHATFVKSADLGSAFGIGTPVVDLDDSALPEAVLVYDLEGEPLGTLKRTNINGPITSPSLGSTALIPGPAFNFNIPAEQPNSAVRIASTAFSTISSSVIKRNGILWGVQTVGNQGREALRWFAIDANTSVLLQEGLIADVNLDLYMGSIAVNEFNDVVIGFNGSSTAQFVSSYAVWGRMRSGVMTFSDPQLLKAGVAPFEQLVGIRPPVAYWGTHSVSVADPTDPFAFWTFQEWVSDKNVWATQITQLVLPKETLNQFVSFVPNVSTFHTTDDVSGCPIGFLGKFSFKATLTNVGSSPIFDPSVVVTTLTNGNLLQNARGGPGGVGATLPVPGSAGFLNTGEAVDVPFTICLAQIQPFTFFVDVLGIVQ